MEPAARTKDDLTTLNAIAQQLTDQLGRIDDMRKLNRDSLKEINAFLSNKDPTSCSYAEGKHTLEWLDIQWMQILKLEDSTNAMLNHTRRQIASLSSSRSLEQCSNNKFGPPDNYSTTKEVTIPRKKDFPEKLTADHSTGISFHAHQSTQPSSSPSSAKSGKNKCQRHNSQHAPQQQDEAFYPLESLHKNVSANYHTSQSEVDEGSGYDETSADGMSSCNSFLSPTPKNNKSQSYLKMYEKCSIKKNSVSFCNDNDNTFTHNEVDFNPKDFLNSTFIGHGDNNQEQNGNIRKAFGQCPSCKYRVTIKAESLQY